MGFDAWFSISPVAVGSVIMNHGPKVGRSKGTIPFIATRDRDGRPIPIVSIPNLLTEAHDSFFLIVPQYTNFFFFFWKEKTLINTSGHLANATALEATGKRDQSCVLRSRYPVACSGQFFLRIHTKQWAAVARRGSLSVAMNGMVPEVNRDKFFR